MKIAFPTNNLKKISKHTSLSKYFAIIELRNGEIKERVALKNPIIELAKQQHTQEAHRGPGAGRIIPQILLDYGVNLFICNEIGENMRYNLMQAGIEVKITNETSINEILNKILEV